MREVLAAPEGTDKMKEIAKAIQEGASAYLSRQFRTVAVFLVVLAVVIFFVLPAPPEATHSDASHPVRSVDRVHPGCVLLGDHGLHRHVAGGARERPHGQRRP